MNSERKQNQDADTGPSAWGNLPFILPFLGVLGVTLFYQPSFEPPAFETELQKLGDPKAPFFYTLLIAIQLLLGLTICGFFFRTYTRHFPFRWHPLSLIVGVVGCAVWIGLVHLGIEKSVYPWLGLGSLVELRPAFDPFQFIEEPTFRRVFLVLRFGLLALLIPLVEELLVRGWLVRWVDQPDWENVSLRSVGPKALGAVLIYAVLTHPSEALAAIAWFSMVNWLMKRTGHFWDCVIAHAVTNLLLGFYVVTFSQWQFW